MIYEALISISPESEAVLQSIFRKLDAPEKIEQQKFMNRLDRAVQRVLAIRGWNL